MLKDIHEVLLSVMESEGIPLEMLRYHDKIFLVRMENFDFGSETTTAEYNTLCINYTLTSIGNKPC